MDFDDTPDEAVFRVEAREWLGHNVARIWRDPRPTDLESRLRLARQYQAMKADAGYVALTWPPESGGQGLPAIFEVIWRQEEERFGVDARIFGIGLQISIQTVMHYTTAENRERYLRPALRGEEIWCQLFSEPAGGSDVAAARTRAVRSGDNWIVNGQKTWITGAHYSDFGIIITRTDPTVPKHKGLTMFFLDMHAPGVEVRPIRQANGESEFNEVFLTDVCVPDTQRLGGVNDGWNAVVTTLMFERFGVGGGMDFAGWKELLQLARSATVTGPDGERAAIEDGCVRERIADSWLREQGLFLNNCRAVTALSRGQTPGPEFSIGKLVAARAGQETAYALFDLLAPDAVRMNPAANLAPPSLYRSWMWGAAMRIAGGTEEVMRNIIAERVLGLPPEVRVDKNIPFDQLKG